MIGQAEGNGDNHDNRDAAPRMSVSKGLAIVGRCALPERSLWRPLRERLRSRAERTILKLSVVTRPAANSCCATRRIWKARGEASGLSARGDSPNLDQVLTRIGEALTQVKHSGFKYLIYRGKMVAGVGFEPTTFRL